MPDQEGVGAKTCVICGKDTAGLLRVKDGQGRYYHKQCREAVKRKLAARGAVPSAARPVAASSRAQTAAPVAPARPASRAAPKAPPAGEGLSLLDELSSVESSATSIEAGAATMCPGCGTMLPPGAVLCVACGYNLKTGARLAAAAVVIPKAKPVKKDKSGGGSTSEKPWLYGGVPLLVLLVLFAVGRGNESVAAIFFIVYVLSSASLSGSG